MTTIVTADLHLAASPRDEYRWQFIERTLPTMVQEYSARRVLVLGDLTEAKDHHGAALVNRLADAVAALAEAAPVYILRGNHDYAAEDAPFFRFLRHAPRVRWINEPERLSLRGLGECFFLPHARDLSSWPDLGAALDWCFCHQTFGGARSESGQLLRGPTPPFPRGARIVSGDVHVPQKLGRVTYVGAPYTVDFGDGFKPRILLVRPGKRFCPPTPTSIPVPGPQKRLIRARSMAELAAAEPNLQPGDVVKVRAEAELGSSRAEVRARVREWAAAVGVNLYAVEITAPATSPSGPRRDRPHASDADLIRAYAKKMKQGKAGLTAGLKIAEEIS